MAAAVRATSDTKCKRKKRGTPLAATIPATAATLRPRIAPRATRGRPGRYNNLAALAEIVFGVFVFRRADISDFFEIFPSAKCRISKCLTLESE